MAATGDQLVTADGLARTLSEVLARGGGIRL